jgi:hypothetical protein
MPWIEHVFFRVAAVSLVLAGCQQQGLPPTVPVRGQVTLDGIPLTKGTVMFYPDRTRGTAGRMAVGAIGPDGRFTLTSFHRGDGVILGHHVVAVVCETDPPTMAEASGSKPPRIRSLIPTKYNGPRSSDLRVEIRQGGTDQCAIHLHSDSSTKPMVQP